MVVLLYPDATHGMQLSVRTVPGDRSTRNNAVQARGVGGGFDPDSVFTWINVAAKVMRPGTDPSGPEMVLLTPTLRSAGGDSIRLMRRPDGAHWARKTTILIDEAGPEGDHFDVLVEPRMVQQLLQGLQREAALSGFNADSVAAELADTTHLEFLAAGDVPSLLRMGKAEYPDRTTRGMIIMHFVIDANGSPDLTTLRTIYADHPVFESWARQILAGTLYAPGRLRGQPVDVLVQQAINFTP